MKRYFDGPKAAPRTVLMSMKSKFANAIYTGSKRYEFRRSHVRIPIGSTVLIYESLPVGRITGEFVVSEIIYGTAELANLEQPGVNRDAVAAYLRGSSRCSALGVQAPARWDVTRAVQRPAPQSYVYLD